MPRSKHQNVAFREAIELHSVEDPDELQLLDEFDSRLVEAWRNAAKQFTGLTVHIIHPVTHVRA